MQELRRSGLKGKRILLKNRLLWLYLETVLRDANQDSGRTRGEDDGSRALTTHQQPDLTGIQVPASRAAAHPPHLDPVSEKPTPKKRPVPRGRGSTPTPPPQQAPHRPQRYRDVATATRHTGTSGRRDGRPLHYRPPASHSMLQQVI